MVSENGKKALRDAFDLGRSGEAVAGRYLQSLNYRIIRRGFRHQRWEIDIIAYDGPTLVFIEVKTRRPNPFGIPEDALSETKRRRIRRVAEAYLLRSGLSDVECRFDVLALIPGNRGGFAVRHIKNAF